MVFNLKKEPLYNLSFYDNVSVLVKSTELCYPLWCKQTLKFIFRKGKEEKQIIKMLTFLTFDTSKTKRKEIQESLLFTPSLLSVSKLLHI